MRFYTSFKKKNTIHYDATDVCNVQCNELPGFDKFIEVHLFKEPTELKTNKITDYFGGRKGE